MRSLTHSLVTHKSGRFFLTHKTGRLNGKKLSIFASVEFISDILSVFWLRIAGGFWNSSFLQLIGELRKRIFWRRFIISFRKSCSRSARNIQESLPVDCGSGKLWQRTTPPVLRRSFQDFYSDYFDDEDDGDLEISMSEIPRFL